MRAARSVMAAWGTDRPTIRSTSIFDGAAGSGVTRPRATDRVAIS
jgi:hypothetical protein